ncbi:MAG: M23 family metallopeptidase [Rhodothermales bacterium]|nr:M23 family metallopeptidase [Rhodothermales bacterium]
MPRNKYYYYDHEACTFVEVQPKRSRVILKGALVLGLALVLAAAGTWTVYETSTTPKELALQEENRALQEQLRLNGQRFAQLSDRLDHLAETDRALYRTIFQADPISDDVRQVGVGGTADAKFDRFSASAARLLGENDAALAKLERQMNLQQDSYEELVSLAHERTEALPQMPAILPTTGPLTSGYGMRRHPIHRVRKLHAGVDFSVPTGTPVYATGAGTVTFAGVSSGYGKNVRIRHGKAKRITLYAHLSEIPDGIRRGTEVERGEVIGISGNTGLSTAPHLHYEIRRLDNTPVDPLYSFAPDVEPSEYLALRKVAESDNAPLD